LPWANAGCDNEAEEVYRQLSKRIKCEIAAGCDDDPSQDVSQDANQYLRLVPEQAVRLATIRAAGRDGHRAKVDVGDMTWGADLGC
jgi:hypothetical protein